MSEFNPKRLKEIAGLSDNKKQKEKNSKNKQKRSLQENFRMFGMTTAEDAFSGQSEEGIDLNKIFENEQGLNLNEQPEEEGPPGGKDWYKPLKEMRSQLMKFKGMVSDPNELPTDVIEAYDKVDDALDILDDFLGRVDPSYETGGHSRRTDY